MSATLSLDGESVLSTFSKDEKIATRCTLSRRETEVFKLIGAGCTSKEIAVELHISKETVSGYRKQICHKLCVHSTAELIAYSLQYLQGSAAPSGGGLTVP